MKMRIMRLLAAALVIAALLSSQVCVSFAGWDDPMICVTKVMENGTYAFKVQRVKDASTGELDSNTDITFTYKIQCESDTYEVIKVLEGSSGIPAGKNDVTVDVTKLVEEMRTELPKHKSISLLCTLKNVKGASLGTIDQIILNNTSDMSEEDFKAFQEMFGGMFENTENKSGSTDTSNSDANAVPKATPAFKGASSWAVAELEKAAGYGFITDRIKDKMNASITREEFAEVAVKLYEKYTGTQADVGDMSVFADTTNPEIFKAYNLKIVNGTNAAQKLFSPKDSTNRQQVAAMLLRTLNAMNPGADLGTAGVGRFADEKDIAPWAIESVRFMNKNGFLKGSDNKIDPNGICTREMAVLIATRVYEKYSGSAADSNADNTIPGDGKSTLDAGYEKLPASFPKVVPILPDAIISTADGFKGDQSGFIMYDTNYSVDEAIKFYSNESLYKGFIGITSLPQENAKAITIEIQGYQIMVAAANALQGAAGNTTIIIRVFGTGFSQG